MAEEFDWSQFEEAPTEEAAPSGTPAPQAQANEQVDWNSFEAVGAVDSNGEPLPSFADGLSMDRPLNKSPLTPEQRAALSVGNEKGSISYLKKNGFQDVQKDSEGNLVVQKEGTWYRVDPNTLGEVDAWTATKGIMRSAAAAPFIGLSAFNPLAYKAAKYIAEGNPVSEEFMGEVGDNAAAGYAVAASVGAGIATGGASTAAQAAGAAGSAGLVETARTSLGRLVGTYEADASEQIKDIAFESVLNLAGVVIPKGVRPSADFIAKQLPWVAKAFRSVDEGSRELIKKTYGSLSGVGSDAIDTIMEHAPRVKTTMERIKAIAGSSDEAYADEVQRQTIRQVKKIAETAPEMMSEVYRAQQAQLVKSVSENFVGSVDESVNGVLKSMVNDDFLKVMVKGKELTPSEAAELMLNTTGKFADDVKFVFRNQKDLQKALAAKGTVGNGVAFDSEAYDQMRTFYSQIEALRGMPLAKGKKGAIELLNTNKILDDMTYKLKTKADNEGMKNVSKLMASYHGAIRGSVEQAFDKHGAKGLFSQLKKSYEGMQDQMVDVLNAGKRASVTGSDQPYAALVTKLQSRGGKNVHVKDSFNSVLNIAKQYGSHHAGKIEAAQRHMRVLDAALKFNPLVRKDVLGPAATLSFTGSAAAGMFGLVNPAVAVMGASGALATSPRLASKAALTTRAMWQMKDFLEAKGSQVLQNPAALNAVVQSVVQATDLADQTEQQLLSPLQQGGGAGGQ